MEIKQKNQSENPIENYSQKIFLLGSVLVSFGILQVTVGGSWDITNHLLNKPETFFSTPHAVMYSGVAISLIGVAISFFGYRNLQNFKNIFSLPLRIKFLGITLLIGAGPFDFIWHLNFGLDGLLSPPHLTLITGMLFCSMGGMFGISRFLKLKSSNIALSPYLLILGILPVWLAGSGIISSLSLPFSNTDYFQLNPDPLMAFIVATTLYPFWISFCSLTASRISNFKPGIVTILGGLFLLIYGLTAISPNFSLLEAALFYSLNLIPFVISDLILSFGKSKRFSLCAGGILGSVFYMVYFPYVMYTYNEVLLGKLVSPSMILHTYFEILPQVLQLTIIPAIIMGIVGVFAANKFSSKILMK